MDTLKETFRVLWQSQWIYPVLVPVLLLWLCRFLWQQMYEYQRDTSLTQPLPPGSMGWPFIGETLRFITGSHDFVADHRKIHKSDVFKTHVLGRPTVVVSGLENIKHILQAHSNSFEHAWPKTVQDLLGPGCTSTLVGKPFKERRRILLGAFSRDTLSQYIAPIRDSVQSAISRWIASGNIVTHPEAKRLAFEMVSRTLVGFQYDSLQDQQLLMKTFNELVSGMFSLRVNLPGFAYHKGKKARQTLNMRLDECRRRMEASPGSDVTTILSILLTKVADGEMSLDDLRDELVLLMFAGHDTTACAMTLAMMNCAQHPHTILKLREELAAFNLNEDVLPTYDLLNRMPYLDSVIREVLKQNAPIGGGFRVALKSLEVGGYQVPKGWRVNYSIRTTQAMIFPTDFNPDRWMNTQSYDDGKNDNRESNDSKECANVKDVLYFGLGSRSCTGKEFAKLFLRVFLVEYVRTCDVTLVNKEVRMNHFPMPTPKDGMPVLVEARKTPTSPVTCTHL